MYVERHCVVWNGITGVSGDLNLNRDGIFSVTFLWMVCYRYFFPCKRWLAIDEDDGQLARELVPVDEAFMRKGDDDEEDSEATLGLEQKGESDVMAALRKTEKNWSRETENDLWGRHSACLWTGITITQCLIHSFYDSNVNNIHGEDKDWRQEVRRNWC